VISTNTPPAFLSEKLLYPWYLVSVEWPNLQSTFRVENPLVPAGEGVIGRWLVLQKRIWVSRRFWREHTVAIQGDGSQLWVLFARSCGFWDGACRKCGNRKTKFESRPGVEYILREDGIQTRRFFWLPVLEGDSKLHYWQKGARDTTVFRSGVRTFHRSDSSLLMSMVDPRLPVLRVRV